MLTLNLRGAAAALLIAGQCAYAGPSQRAENFANPPSRMRILPCRHDRGRSEKSIAAELDYLEGQGFGGMAFNVKWDKDYLCNDGDLALFAKSARAAHARGMTLWLYDEYGYPSGTAARLVLKDHPEWQARGALIAYSDAKGGEEVCVKAPPGKHLLSVALPLRDGRVAADSAVSLPAPVDGQLAWRAPEGGRWRVCVITEDAVYKGTHASVNVMLKVPYINLLQPEPVKRFIEVTHERYAALFDPKEFSEIFTSTFTDEPSLMQWVRPMPYLNLPWCGELPADYRERTGRDLVTDIPRIAFGTTEENDRRWRGAYWRMVGERVRSNYTDQLRAWCEGHGIRSGGHLLAEEAVGSLTGLYGDFFGVLRGFTAPGVDCLRAYPAQISPLTPLYASSAAALNDVPIVMCEYTSHGATPEKHPSQEESLGCAFKLIAGGITQMTSYHRFHAFKTYAEKKTFNDRVGRAIAIVDGTSSAAEIAMYYPTEALQSMYLLGFGGGGSKESSAADGNFKRTGTELYEASRSFLIIDAAAVRAAKIEGRELVHGRLRWKAVVLPWASVLPPDIAEKLDAFRRAGGTVLATGKRPDSSPENFPDVKIAAFGAELELVDCADLGRRLRELLPPALDVGDSPTPVRVLRRRDDGGMVFLLYNDSPEPWKGRVTISSRPERMELWRPVEGDHRTCSLDNGSLEIEIPGYGAVGLTEELGAHESSTLLPYGAFEREMFLGDSITCHNMWTFDAEFIHAISHPGSNAQTLNRGIGGDYAGGGFKRLGWDVFPANPGRVFVMFGMNDVRRHLWADEVPSENVAKQRAKAIEDHASSMAKLVNALTGKGIKVVLVTPSPYDAYGKYKVPALKACNDGLGQCAERTRKLAAEKGLPVVDLHAPLTAFAKAHPDFGLCGQDRIHPGARGHLLMAVELMRQSGSLPPPATYTFDAAGAVPFTFTVRPKRLPFPVTKSYAEIDALYPLDGLLNPETLKVAGLPSGDYSLECEGRTLGTFTAAELAKGVNPARLDTPASRRARKAYEACGKLKAAAQRARSTAPALKIIYEAGGNPSDRAAADAILDRDLEKKRQLYSDNTNARNASVRSFCEWIVSSYRKDRDKTAELDAEVEKARSQMRDLCSPVEYTITVRKAKNEK